MCKYYLKYAAAYRMSTRLKAIPEESAGCMAADSDSACCCGRCGRSSAEFCGSAGSCCGTGAARSTADSRDSGKYYQHSPRDAKLRLARQLHEEDHRRRVRELMESERLAEDARRRQEAERRRRAEEARQRDAERRRVVEERRRRLMDAERERREALLRRHTSSPSSGDAAAAAWDPPPLTSPTPPPQRFGRTGMPFAFGSCIPREVCEPPQLPSPPPPPPQRSHSAGGGGHHHQHHHGDCESAHMRSHRRAVSCATGPTVSRTRGAAQRFSPVGADATVASGSLELSGAAASAQHHQVRLRRPPGSSAAAAAAPGTPQARSARASLRDSQMSAASTRSSASGKSTSDATPKSPQTPGKRRQKAPDADRLSRLAQPRVFPSASTSALHHRMAVSATEHQLASRLLVQTSPRPAKVTIAVPPAAASAASKTPTASNVGMMTKSMVELPSDKRPVRRPTIGKVASKQVAFHAADSTLAATSPIPMVPAPAASTLPTRTRSIRPTELALPKSQSAMELQKAGGAAPQRRPQSALSEEVVPEACESAEVSTAASEAKRRFEEQRRLHRERLEAERRAEEERRQREEEFRRRREAEAARKRQEALEAERAALETAAREAEEQRRRSEAEREKLEAEAARQASEALAARQREEAERAARQASEEAERLARLEAEEAERAERRRRLQSIMHRVKPMANAAAAFEARTPSPAAAAGANEADYAMAATAAAAAMTVSMPPTVLAEELMQSPQSPQTTDLAVLADRLKGTKAAEILARRSGSQTGLSTAGATVAATAAAAPNAASADSDVQSRLAAVRARLRPASATLPMSAVSPSTASGGSAEKDEDAESGVSSPQSALGDGELLGL